MSQARLPEVLLLVSSNCPHCHLMMTLLEQKYQQGLLSKLEIVNIEQNQAVAEKYSVRSVPWLKLGNFVFSGAMTASELDKWIDACQQTEGDQLYLQSNLEKGNLQGVIDYISEHPDSLSSLLRLLFEDTLKMNVRIGIGAVVEHFSGSSQLQQALPVIREILKDPQGENRADACYYLALTGHEDIKEDLQALLKDSNHEVRSIAEETLAELE